MKKYRVRVAPRSSRVSVEEEGGILKVHLTKPAADNEANEQLIEVLAGYFKVKRYQIRILLGEVSRNKVIGVDA